MSEVFFVSKRSEPPPRWSAAFSNLVLYPSVDTIGVAVSTQSIGFIDSDSLSNTACASAIQDLVAQGFSLVLISAFPTEAQAFSALTKGVKGYCHSAAVPEQLRDVVAAIKAGGIWMPASLLQRIVRGVASAKPEFPNPLSMDLEQLTEREFEVASAVARGFSNREIAVEIGVSERTVKAHLTAIFDKCSLRDRVQLALAFTASI
jgi:DNA-binding NarL/FixJ family response regulator